MRFLKALIPVLAAVILVQSGLFAANPREKTDEKKDDKSTVEKNEESKAMEAIKKLYSRLQVGAKVYMDWYWVQGYNSNSYDRLTNYYNYSGVYLSNLNASEKNNNTFRINRAYLDVRYKIADWLTARVTSDVDASVTPTGASNAAFHLYLKYAYLEAKKDFGPVMLSCAGGMIETPVIGFIDKISDYRWINQNYLDNSKAVLNNQGLDNSADLGVKASIGIMKWATITGAFTNGEGYKANETVSEKAITGLVTINPSTIEALKPLYLSGFGRYEITSKYDFTGKKASRMYYGYGVAYSSDIIKVGVNHIFPYVKSVGLASYFNTAYKYGSYEFYLYPTLTRGYMLVDAWLNFNPGAVVKDAPLLVTGRYAYGLQRGTYQKLITDKECGKKRETHLYQAGVGWQFNKNFRILLGGELQKYFVKKNSYLRANESQTSGSDYFNASGTGAGFVYVGSKNPRDTKRVYVKAEVSF